MCRLCIRISPCAEYHYGGTQSSLTLLHTCVYIKDSEMFLPCGFRAWFLLSINQAVSSIYASPWLSKRCLRVQLWQATIYCWRQLSIISEDKWQDNEHELYTYSSSCAKRVHDGTGKQVTFEQPNQLIKKHCVDMALSSFVSIPKQENNGADMLDQSTWRKERMLKWILLLDRKTAAIDTATETNLPARFAFKCKSARPNQVLCLD